MKKITQLKNLKSKTVFVRVDFNIPFNSLKFEVKSLKLDSRGLKNLKTSNWAITDDFKIKAALPTIKYLLKQKARVILISHLGRPQKVKSSSPEADQSLAEKFRIQTYSLKPMVNHLEKLLKRKVEFIKDYKQVANSKAKLILLENIRFDKREQVDNVKLKKQLAKQLAELGDILVFESFASSHRRDSSVYYLPDYLPTYVGFRVQAELKNLKLTRSGGKVMIVGGAKISTKVRLMKKLLPQVDYLLVGGALANTFLVALGLPIGKSLYEPSMVSVCKKMINRKILLPIDVVVESKGKRQIRPVSEVKNYDKIYDIGPTTIEYYTDIIKAAKTVIWNGPMGIFEKTSYAKGSYSIAMAVAATKGKTIVGGGETLAIINYLKLYRYYNFISTGGGAMLNFLENKKLPILEKLNIK